LERELKARAALPDWVGAEQIAGGGDLVKKVCLEERAQTEVAHHQVTEGKISEGRGRSLAKFSRRGRRLQLFLF